jgi:DNA gyrase subunit A
MGTVRPTGIVDELQEAYLDYAMSVIVARALPDVRDGLKPVHRRIAYAMWHDLGLTSDKPHKKCARIVGEVLGKYHPHGDNAVYDALVRMAQDFSLRYPLVDGQGNFGSVDGDNAAAMRYTEARLAELSNLLLEDLEKDTVEWRPNFDNSLREPEVLPAALPNLLINGSSGIAVGMATNIPPHNLGEVVDALTYMIDHFDHVEDVTTDDLLQFVKGPDFPTGGIVYRYRDENKGEPPIDVIAQGYSTGRARLIMQAKAHFEEMSRGRMRIVVTELPYQTNKTSLLERIADLVRDGKLEGLSDLRDESDRTGMRVVIELKRDVDPKGVLADLFKYTPLQQTFGMQLLALVDGQPKLLTLKRMLHLFIKHRQEIIRRRSEYELARARERLHIVEGLLRALDIMDEVIATIRKSMTVDTARKNLVANFKFSEVQAQAILDMQLRRLAALERKKLQEEHDELVKRIHWLEELLTHPEVLLALIRSDLLKIKEQYADVRRTQIVDLTKGTHTTHDLLPDHDVWVAVSDSGEVRRQDVARLTQSTLRNLSRDSAAALLQANTRDVLYLFTAAGRCARIGIHELPTDGARQLSELGLFTRRDRLVAALAVPRNAPTHGYVFLATEGGDVKRVSLDDLAAPTAADFAVIGMGETERLGWAFRTQGDQEVILVTASGQAIRFAEEEVRSMGLAAGGVGGIRLGKKDKVVFAGPVEPDGWLATVTQLGFVKLTALGEFPRQGRNGGGVVSHKLTLRGGDVAAAAIFAADRQPKFIAFLPTKGSSQVLELDDVPRVARSTLGKLMVEVQAGAPIARIRSVMGSESGEQSAPERSRRVEEVSVSAETVTPMAQAATPAGKAVAAVAKPATATPARSAPLPIKPVKSHVGAESDEPRKTAAAVPIKPVATAPPKAARTPRVTDVEPKAPPSASPKPAQSAAAPAATEPQPAVAQQPTLFDEPLPPAVKTKVAKLRTVTSVKK